ncbi:MAG TPA: hypothetical protein VGB64_07875 [Actinomycetota bacterium]
MRRIAGVVVLALAVPGAPAGADPLVTPSCTDVSVEASVFRTMGAPFPDVLENLGFDGLGAMWVANSTTGRVHKLDPSGTDLGSFAVASPGALTMGPDGKMYANFGDAVAGAALRTGHAGVVRFDPSAPNPGAIAPEPFASGLDMANGGIFDDEGNYYASNDVGDGLVKIAPDGTADRDWVSLWGTNGLVVAGDSLYAAITFDQRSPIERIPLADPAAHHTAAQTTFGVASLEPRLYTEPDAQAPLAGVKGLDDMTLGPDGRLWVTANGTGEVLRVDPQSGASCLVASGLQNPSSIRFASSFGLYDGDAFVTEFSGTIRRLHLV